MQASGNSDPRLYDSELNYDIAARMHIECHVVLPYTIVQLIFNGILIKV